MALFHKYPYTDIHDLNLDWILKVVKEMKDKFDSIDFDYIFNTLTSLNNITAQHTELIAQIQGDIDSIGGQILQLRDDLNSGLTDVNGRIDGISSSLDSLSNTVATNTSDISEIKSSISDIRDDLADLGGITSEVSGLESEVDNLDTRVTSLESAAFGDVSVSPVPKNFGCYCIDPSKMDYEIIQDTVTPDPSWDWTVMMASNPLYQNGKEQIRFRGNEYYNKSHLIIKNFIPKMQNSDPLTLLFKFNYTWDYTSNCQALNTSFGALLSGVDCIAGGSTSVCIGGARLVPSVDNLDIYDLYLSAQSLSGSGAWIENSGFFLNYVAILGGTGYLGDGRINLDAGEKYFNAFNLNTGSGSGPSQADFDALVSRVSDAEDDIDTLESGLSTAQGNINTISGQITTINSKDASQDSSISSLGSRVTALEQSESIESWDRWQDVYDEGSITPNSRIIGFHMVKIGKMVFFEIAGCHFRNDQNHNTSTFILGTIRSGLRSKLAPKNNIPVTFTGGVFYTDGNLTGIEMSGDSDSQYCPLVPKARGVSVMTIYGSETATPYTWSGRVNKPYSININICDMPYQTAEQSITNNAFIVRGSYLTN